MKWMSAALRTKEPEVSLFGTPHFVVSVSFSVKVGRSTTAWANSCSSYPQGGIIHDLGHDRLFLNLCHLQGQEPSTTRIILPTFTV